MSGSFAVEVKDVNKTFKVYHDKGHMLKERVIHWKRNKYEKKVVLENISFCIQKGEAVGLIGKNGCGKSTTLKLLTGIMYPDSGSIRLNGRVSSLLELGAGFHPDLSGRENIYINASIFGLSRKEIDQRAGDIIRFSELSDFIDNPVRTYSSGMYMKLAFSIAINVDADILLVDEILAVGDVNFQAKCLNKMKEIKGMGTTIIIVSHSMEQIESICDRSIWLQNGRIAADGLSKTVDDQYLSYMNQVRRESVEEQISEMEKSQQIEQNLDENTKEWSGDGNVRFGSRELSIKNVRCLNSKGEPVNTLDFGEKFSIQFDVEKRKPAGRVWFGLTIIRNDGAVCYGTNTIADDLAQFCISEAGAVCMAFDQVQLMPGGYYIDVCIGRNFNEFIDYWQSAKTIEIFGKRKDIGIVKMEHHWIVEA